MSIESEPWVGAVDRIAGSGAPKNVPAFPTTIPEEKRLAEVDVATEPQGVAYTGMHSVST